MPKLTNESLALKLGWTKHQSREGHTGRVTYWQPRQDIISRGSSRLKLPNWLGDPTTIIAEIEARGLHWHIVSPTDKKSKPTSSNNHNKYGAAVGKQTSFTYAKTPALALATALAAYLDSQEG